MKDYKKVLEISETISSKTARHNKYVKLKISTEDPELKRLLQMRIDTGRISEELISYCKDRIYSKIPLWQLMAIKNKWKRPNKD
jgi:hypothetical protein